MRHQLIGLGLLGALLAGCGGSDSVNVAAPAVASAPAPSYAQVLQPRLEQLRQELGVPGAVVMVHTRAGDWSTALGSRDVAGSAPVQVDDYFRMASNTKTMTATIILQLIDEGRLRFEDPISRFVPGVPNGAAISLQQLLEMRSGLYNYTEDAAFESAIAANPTRVWTPAELLAIAFSHPPDFAPGANFEYCNTNYVLLGQVIQQVTGESLPVVFQRRIFGPLGLTHTSWPLTNAIPNPHAEGYVRGAAGLVDITEQSPTIADASGQVISTVPEVFRYVTTLVDGGLLTPAMQRRRLASVAEGPGVLDPSSKIYGLGLLRFAGLIGHDGDFPGYNSFMGRDPNADITIVVWTSLSDAESPAIKMTEVIYSTLTGYPYTFTPTAIGPRPPR